MVLHIFLCIFIEKYLHSKIIKWEIYLPRRIVMTLLDADCLLEFKGSLGTGAFPPAPGAVRIIFVCASE